MVKVSVVIPIYNVEEFLDECLTGIVNQTLSDIEIICINDGSTDNSLEILNKYANDDDRIIILNQENKGHAVACNRGIDLAKGEYLYLMDSDDMLKTSALEELYDYAKKKSADFVLFQSNNYSQDEDVYYNSAIYSMDNVADFIGDSVVDYNDLGDLIFEIPVTPWSKLYDLNFINKINVRFPEGLIFDDNIFFWDVLFNATRIAFYRKYFFTRRWYSYSSTTAGDLRFIDAIEINNLMLNRFEKYGLLEKYKKVLFNRKIDLNYGRFIRIKDIYQKEYYTEFNKDCKKIVSDDLYDEYMDVLDDRNKKIFLSCLESDTFKEFKYEMAYYDSNNLKIEFEKNNWNLKVNNNNLIKTNNDLKKQVDDLSNECNSLKEKVNILANENTILKKEIDLIKNSNSWRYTEFLRKFKRKI